MNISADTLDFINGIQNSSLFGNSVANPNTTPTVGQSTSHNLANAAITPWTNATNNFQKTVNDIRNPVGGVLQSGMTDASDLYNLKHNPLGGQQQQPMGLPKLSDEHLGPPNAQGNRPVMDNGKAFLLNAGNNFGIGDNTSLLAPSSSPDANMGIQPPVSTKQSNPLAGVASGAAKDYLSSSSATGAAGATEGGSTLESLLALL